MTSPEAAALQTEIRTLGPCKLDSALPYRTWADDKIVRRKGRLYVINKKNPKYKQRQG